jgi:hypothetical protein
MIMNLPGNENEKNTCALIGEGYKTVIRTSSPTTELWEISEKSLIKGH